VDCALVLFARDLRWAIRHGGEVGGLAGKLAGRQRAPRWRRARELLCAAAGRRARQRPICAAAWVNRTTGRNAGAARVCDGHQARSDEGAAVTRRTPGRPATKRHQLQKAIRDD